MDIKTLFNKIDNNYTVFLRTIKNKYGKKEN